ncbi:hypothetical protein TNCV_5136071 [Trichonephila clavipes]|nr:hypothetical protein TNCV_5136071 [Trichonephila clavipes]
MLRDPALRPITTGTTPKQHRAFHRRGSQSVCAATASQDCRRPGKRSPSIEEHDKKKGNKIGAKNKGTRR